MRSDIIIRIRSGIVHIEIESTGIIVIIPITACISDITAIQIRIIEMIKIFSGADMTITLPFITVFLAYKYIKRATTLPFEPEAE